MTTLDAGASSLQSRHGVGGDAMRPHAGLTITFTHAVEVCMKRGSTAKPEDVRQAVARFEFESLRAHAGT